MRPEEELRELQERINGLSDEELLAIVEVDAAEYREEAVEFARAALLARGIELDEGSAEEEEDGVVAESLPITAPRTPLICTVCGGETRFGILFAHRELTFLFPDENREGAVEAYACRHCGRIQLILDWETEVLREEDR